MSLLEWQAQLDRLWLQPVTAGECAPPAGVAESALALYGELLRNTVQDTLENIYPYTFRLLSRNAQKHQPWDKLADHYRRACPNASYKLTGAVAAFPSYLAAQTSLMALYPFLHDLALYEWLDMVALNLPDPDQPPTLSGELPPIDALTDYSPVWNPARCLQHFEFQVPEILDALQAMDFRWRGKSANPVFQPGPVDMLIYRDPDTLNARFFRLNALTALLLRISGSGVLSYQEALASLQAAVPALQTISPPVLTLQAMGLFQTCLEKGMLLGSQKR